MCDGTAPARVRTGARTELAAVANVLDGAALALEPARLRRAIERGDVLVAVAGDDADDRILGALALDGREILAVAVRRRRRGQGIGTALVEAATERSERLVAEFDAAVRPFWESLGFEVAPAAGRDRYRGLR